MTLDQAAAKLGSGFRSNGIKIYKYFDSGGTLEITRYPKSWVVVSNWPDGGKTALEFPTFKKMKEAIDSSES